MTDFQFLTRLEYSGFRLPIICHSLPDSVHQHIFALEKVLMSNNMTYEIIDCSSQLVMQNQIKSLGKETKHVIVNATKGIHLKGFLALIGKLTSTSLFFLFIPPKSVINTINDNSASSWFNFNYHEADYFISAPIFNAFLYSILDKIKACIQIDAATFNWNDLPSSLGQHVNNFCHDPFSLPRNGQLTKEQGAIFNAIINSDEQIILLSAKRGRGKTFTLHHLIYFLIHQNKRLLLTGNRKSLYQANEKHKQWHIPNGLDMSEYFLAPEVVDKSIDYHIQNSANYPYSEWLIIDEAAMISFSSIKKWIPYFNKVLLVTTLDGYEGSGQALKVKLANISNKINYQTLNQPIRFSLHCPLNRLSESLMIANSSALPALFKKATAQLNACQKYNATSLENLKDNSMFKQSKTSSFQCSSRKDITLSNALQNNNNELINNHLKKINFSIIKNFDIHLLSLAQTLYYFFKHIHYQTTPNDLRRLLDGQNQCFFIASDKTLKSADAIKNLDVLPIKAASWVLFEGGASIDLAKKIWLGERRPKANLVAQSLATHANNPIFPSLRGMRISRIGVLPFYRRVGLASQLVKKIISEAKQLDIDYVSVSFGFENELFEFWLKQGFTLVHISHRADASSGEPSVMMLYPISSVGISETVHCINYFNAYCDVIKKLTSPTKYGIFTHLSDLIERLSSNTHTYQHELNNQLNNELANKPTRFEYHPIYCLCAFAFHHKTFLTTLPAFIYLLTENSLFLPKVFKDFWDQFIENGEFPTKSQTQQLRKIVGIFLNEYFYNDVINFNHWISDSTSFIIE